MTGQPTHVYTPFNPADNGTANEPVTLGIASLASTAAGDLCVLVGLLQVATTGQITMGVTGGQTWSTIVEYAANDLVFAVTWCEFNGTWSANPSLIFAAQSGTQPASIVMPTFRKTAGDTGSWQLDTAFVGASEASASPVVVTGITPTADFNVSLAGWALANASTWGTLSGTGWTALATAQFRNLAGSDQSMTFAYQTQGTAAATNDVSQVPSTAGVGISFTMAWKIVAPGTGGLPFFMQYRPLRQPMIPIGGMR